MTSLEKDIGLLDEPKASPLEEPESQDKAESEVERWTNGRCCKNREARSLLSAIKMAIDNRCIQTWSYDADGDFTHTADQWTRGAWLRPVVREDRLVFNIVPPRARTISRVVYGIYHGHFIEMLLNHFDKNDSQKFRQQRCQPSR